MADHQWPEAARKRMRDDEVESIRTANGLFGFTEHRNKRLHCTAMRLAPTRQWPGSSDFPENNNTATPGCHPEVVHATSAMPQMDIDQDADMTIDHLDSPDVLEPHETTPNSTGRIPTPIHCTFAAQVRGNHWGVMPLTDDSCDIGMFPDDDVPAQQYQDPSVPRSVTGITEWSLVQNRRLPSPISENGGEETAASPEMVLDNNCFPGHGHLQPHHQQHTPHSSGAQAIPLHPNIRLSPQPADADASMMDTADAGSPSSAPATPSQRAKYGHSRSKHTINTWTLQPGMKKSFSIGYRADCEKCRMKIPGHFNHIIIS